MGVYDARRRWRRWMDGHSVQSVVRREGPGHALIKSPDERLFFFFAYFSSAFLPPHRKKERKKERKKGSTRNKFWKKNCKNKALDNRRCFKRTKDSRRSIVVVCDSILNQVSAAALFVFATRARAPLLLVSSDIATFRMCCISQILMRVGAFTARYESVMPTLPTTTAGTRRITQQQLFSATRNRVVFWWIFCSTSEYLRVSRL